MYWQRCSLVDVSTCETIRLLQDERTKMTNWVSNCISWKSFAYLSRRSGRVQLVDYVSGPAPLQSALRVSGCQSRCRVSCNSLFFRNVPSESGAHRRPTKSVGIVVSLLHTDFPVRTALNHSFLRNCCFFLIHVVTHLNHVEFLFRHCPLCHSMAVIMEYPSLSSPSQIVFEVMLE